MTWLDSHKNKKKRIDLIGLQPPTDIQVNEFHVLKGASQSLSINF